MGLFQSKSSVKRSTFQRSFTSRGEQECKDILSKLYPQHQFQRVRPNFLKNPKTGRNLELDCYCPELKLAVEYQGRQHYYYDSHFHKSKKEFYEQLERDHIKQALCIQNGIRLIQVPYTVPNIEEYLQWMLKK